MQLLEPEGVDRTLRRYAVVRADGGERRDFGNRRISNRLKRPVRLGASVAGRGCGCRGRRGPRGAEFDPRLERRDLVVGQLRFRRHGEIAFVPHGREEQALGRLAGDNRRARVAAAEQGLPRIDAEVALLLVGAVALLARFDQQRANLSLEEFFGGGGRCGLFSARRGGPTEHNRAERNGSNRTSVAHFAWVGRGNRG